MKGKILVTPRSFRKYTGPHQDMLREAGYEVINSPFDRLAEEDEMVEMLRDVDGCILGLDKVTARAIASAKRLKVISRYGVGVDNIDLDAATAAGIVVTSTPGTNHVAVAEFTLGLILALARSIPQQIRIAKSGSFNALTGIELAGSTLGIVGLGHISREVISRALALSMRVLVHTNYPDAGLKGVEYVPLNRLLIEADFVSLHCAFTPDRLNLIGAEELKAMKPTAYLINTARGELIDEDALYLALKEGWIAGAACDVFVHEPPVGSPLLELDNFIATPHAGARTHQAVMRMGILASENALKVLRGERPEHVLNPQVYGE
ncbi:MAG: phosphoglycerate dehydrogenase [Anaerolineae bacterium]